MTINSRADIRRIVEDAKVSAEAAVQVFVDELSQEIVRRTPVDTGFLRANWQIGLDDDPKNIRETREPGGPPGLPPPAPETIARISAAMNEFRGGQTVYFVNNAKYAGVIEYGTRDGKRAGRAMIRSTLAMLPEIERRAIEFIRGFRASRGGG